MTHRSPTLLLFPLALALAAVALAPTAALAVTCTPDNPEYDVCFVYEATNGVWPKIQVDRDYGSVQVSGRAVAYQQHSIRVTCNGQLYYDVPLDANGTLDPACDMTGCANGTPLGTGEVIQQVATAYSANAPVPGLVLAGDQPLQHRRRGGVVLRGQPLQLRRALPHHEHHRHLGLHHQRRALQWPGRRLRRRDRRTLGRHPRWRL